MAVAQFPLVPLWRAAESDSWVLQSGHVDLWRIDLDDLAVSTDVLSDDERIRADRYAYQHLRSRFIAARTALRYVLSRYLAYAPAKIRFKLSELGKPSIAEPDGNSLAFNLSHSDQHALIALVSEGDVGVDIEIVRDIPELAAITQDILAPKEIAAINRLAPERRPDAFFAAWTRKEAIAKYTGDGLSLDFRSVMVDPETTTQTISIARVRRPVEEIAVTGFKPSADAWAAVAAPGSSSKLRFWRLPGQ